MHSVWPSIIYTWGGSFQHLGGGPCGLLGRVRLDGTGALDAALLPSLQTNYAMYDEGVEAIAVSGSAVYAGGDFQFAIDSGYQVSFLVKVNLATRQIDPTWTPLPNAEVNALVLSGTSLFIGGDFDSISAQDPAGDNMGNITQTYLALLSLDTGALNDVWDPPFTDNGNGNGNGIDALATDGTSLFAGSDHNPSPLPEGGIGKAIELLKDKEISPGALRILKRVNAVRQIEMAEMMVSTNNYAKGYVEALFMGTPKDQLANPEAPKKLPGMSAADIAKMEHEMEGLEHDFKAIEDTYGQNVLHLTLARGYVKKPLENARVVRFLSAQQPDIFREFEALAAAESL